MKYIITEHQHKRFMKSISKFLTDEFKDSDNVCEIQVHPVDEEEFDYEVDMGGPFNEDLREIQGYLRDEDDSYDCTYASFYYEVPEKFKYLLDKLKSMAMKETQEERWENAIERIKTANADDPLVSKVTEAFKPLFEQITKATEQE